MTEQQFTDEYEAPEADAAEQSLPVDDEARDAGLASQSGAGGAAGGRSGGRRWARPFPVPVDEDEYR